MQLSKMPSKKELWKTMLKSFFDNHCPGFIKIIFWSIYHSFQTFPLLFNPGKIICIFKNRHNMILEDYVFGNHRVILNRCKFCKKEELLEVMRNSRRGWVRYRNIEEIQYENNEEFV